MTSFTGNVCITLALLIGVTWVSMANGSGERKAKQLPPRDLVGRITLEKTIAQRRSVRDFADKALAIEQIGQLCWAGQGITDKASGFRASPSAGALYPIELYIVTAEAVDRYRPKDHSLERQFTGDVRPALHRAGLGQEPIGDAPVCVVITAVVERTARKYGERAERYCFLEAGHVAQNILLQATALDLGGVPIGAFDEEQVGQVLRLPKGQRVLYLLPIGHPSR